MRAIISPSADHDLEEAALFIGRHAPRTSLRFAKAVERTLAMIEALPEIGPPISVGDAGPGPFRKFGVRGFKHYLIFYRIEPNRIEIVRVLHASRDSDAILRRE